MYKRMWKNKKGFNEGCEEITISSKISFTHLLSYKQGYYISRTSNYVFPSHHKITNRKHIETGYQCSILDYHSVITLIHEKNEGTQKYSKNKQVIILYKPKKINYQLLKQLSNQETFFPITGVFNKTQKFSGLCFLLNDSNMVKKTEVKILFKVKGFEFVFQYSLATLKYELYLLFQIDHHEKNLLKLKLGKNQKNFLAFLHYTKIYCHYGTYFQIYFQNQNKLNLFLYGIMKWIHNPLAEQIIKNAQSQNESFVSKKRIETSEVINSDLLTNDSPTDSVLNTKLASKFNEYSQKSPKFFHPHIPQFHKKTIYQNLTPKNTAKKTNIEEKKTTNTFFKDRQRKKNQKQKEQSFNAMKDKQKSKSKEVNIQKNSSQAGSSLNKTNFFSNTTSRQKMKNISNKFKNKPPPRVTSVSESTSKRGSSVRSQHIFQSSKQIFNQSFAFSRQNPRNNLFLCGNTKLMSPTPKYFKREFLDTSFPKKNQALASKEKEKKLREENQMRLKQKKIKKLLKFS